MDSTQVGLEVTGNDELADLAVAVNEMARDLCLIRDVSATANAADEKTGVALQTTLDRIATIRDWPVAHAFLVDSDGHAEDEPLELWNRDLAARFQPFRAATTEMCRGSDRGLIDRVVDSNQSVWVSSIEADTHCVRRDIAGEVGIQTAFAFPIRVGTTVVAVVEMFSIRGQRPNGGIIRIAEQIGSQIARVFERNRTARELERLHKQLADSAHREGMAEVATSVLHNVGNVLNSVNVSAALVRDIIEHSEMRLYRKAIDLLESHLGELSQYIEQDPKGRHLPRYLLAGARRLDDEFRDIDARVTSL
jgi:hypothetical protein